MKIICLGDSLTAGAACAAGRTGWSCCGADGRRVDQRGRLRRHVDGILVRLQTEVLPQRPDEVLLMGGDNDIMLTGWRRSGRKAP